MATRADHDHDPDLIHRFTDSLRTGSSTLLLRPMHPDESLTGLAVSLPTCVPERTVGRGGDIQRGSLR